MTTFVSAQNSAVSSRSIRAIKILSQHLYNEYCKTFAKIKVIATFVLLPQKKARRFVLTTKCEGTMSFRMFFSPDFKHNRENS